MECIKKDGYNFTFNPNACKVCQGKCCIGESGYIWINKSEMEYFIKFLNIDEDSFKKNYLEKVGFRYTLKEIEYNGGFSCIFFDMEKRCCKVYNIRPNQCRSYPFWEYFKENLDELESECLGIMRL